MPDLNNCHSLHFSNDLHNSRKNIRAMSSWKNKFSSLYNYSRHLKKKTTRPRKEVWKTTAWLFTGNLWNFSKITITEEVEWVNLLLPVHATLHFINYNIHPIRCFAMYRCIPRGPISVLNKSRVYMKAYSGIHWEEESVATHLAVKSS